MVEVVLFHFNMSDSEQKLITIYTQYFLITKRNQLNHKKKYQF